MTNFKKQEVCLYKKKHIIFVDDEITKHAPVNVWHNLIHLPLYTEMHLFVDPAEAYAKVMGLGNGVKLVIADYAMPGCDGLQFLQEVKFILGSARLVLISNLDCRELDLKKDFVDKVYLKEDMELGSNLQGFPSQIEWIIHEQLACSRGIQDENKSLLLNRSL